MLESKLGSGSCFYFTIPLEEIGSEFEKESGISLRTTVSSTGKLFTQIKNGAPYDLFFAADSLRPELLFKEGLGSKPVVYARGQTVLWTADKALCEKGSWQKAVTAQGVGKIGIANPETAPYGEVAEQALQQAGLWGDVFRKLVFAGNVGQSAQYAAMGSVSMSFTAGSFTVSSHGQKGCFWSVPEADAVIQKACIIKRSEKKDTAEQFLAFLHSPEAREVLLRYKYN
jgi:molybdate transport system substrate-binding protein